MKNLKIIPDRFLKIFFKSPTPSVTNGTEVELQVLQKFKNSGIFSI